MTEQDQADYQSIRQKRLLKLEKLNQNKNESSNENNKNELAEKKEKESSLMDMSIDNSPKITPKTVLTNASSSSLNNNSISSISKNKNKNKTEAIIKFLSQSEIDFDDQQYENIFNCTLKKDNSNNNLIFLQDLYEELLSEELPLKIDSSIIERVIISRLSMPQNSDVNAIPLFDYLIECWKKLCEVQRKIKKLLQTKLENEVQKKELEEKIEERINRMNASSKLIISYSGFVISPGLNEMFPQSERVLEMGPKCIAIKLLNSNSIEVENQLPNLFLSEFIKRFEENLGEIFEPVIKYVMDEMNKQNLNKEYVHPLRVISTLVTYKSIAALIPTFSFWNPEGVQPREIEEKSFLGAFYSKVSAFPDSDSGISQSFFSNRNSFGNYSSTFENEMNGFGIGSRKPVDVDTAMNSLRTIVNNVQTNLYTITMAIIRATPSSNPTSREAVLKYFGDVIMKNQSREKIQVDRREVSTDGFMYSISRVCHQLCEPFLDPTFKKINLIDMDYLIYNNRFDITEHTRISFDLNQSKEYTEKWKNEHPEAPKPNFITEIFYITMAVYHYGYLSIIRFYQHMLKQIEEIRKQVKKMNQEKASGLWTNLGIRKIINEQLLIKYQTELDIMIDHKLAMDAVLLNNTVLSDVFSFYNLVIVWMLRLILVKSNIITVNDKINWSSVAAGNNNGKIDLRNFPNEAPDAFKVLPEWIIDDICEFLVFICRYQAPIFETVSRNELMTFIMILLKNSNYVKNPYLKAKFAEILSCFTVPLYRNALGQTSGRLDLIFGIHPLARDLLVEDLMKFYIDIEQTGMHTQFYDKFNIRYSISQVLKCVWEDAIHRNQIIKQSRNTSFFVHFANLLMNDTTYLLDEALTKLTEIHSIQNEMIDVATWNQQSEQYRAEREGVLRADERQAISYMSLGNETVHMLSYLTSDPQIIQPFMEPEIVERLAAMMDYNLTALVGPKCTELKVNDPEKYRFNPKKLLTELMDIYIHLSHRKEFINAVARDGRSYRPELFEQAKRILIKNTLKGQDDIVKIVRFVENVEKEVKNISIEEEMDQDIPDEFLDPLLYTLMEDPVILPTSHQTVDRSTIKSHLLSDSHDPFNRQPLTIEMVIPNVELKEKIEEYKKNRNSKKSQM